MPALGRDGGDQGRRLAADDHDRGDHALLELLDGGRRLEFHCLDLDAERLEQSGGGHGRSRAGRAEIDLLAGQPGEVGDIGAGQHVDLLRGEPCHELDPVLQAALRGHGLGKRVGRDEGDIDMRIVEQEREIAHAVIAEHRRDAQTCVLREQAGQVGRQHRFRGGRRSGDQAEPSRAALALRECAIAGEHATEGETK